MRSSVTKRALTPDDGPALHRILGDPEVGPWHRPAGRTESFSLEECVAFAERHAAHWTRFDFGLWLVRSGPGEPVAWGGAHHTAVGGRAEIELAWSVASAHWGNGIAVQLARAGLALTAARGLTGVVSFTRADNHRSRRVMEKAGLRFESELEHAGHPSVLYRERPAGEARRAPRRRRDRRPPASAPSAPGIRPSRAAR